MRLVLFISLFFICSLSADVYCSQCKLKISGQYLLDGNKKAYCSKSCFNKTLPSCSICRNKITGKYKKSESQIFCSQRCLNTILPKCRLCKKPSAKTLKIDESRYCETCSKNPRCFTCSHPFTSGFGHADGRKFCVSCKDDLIFNEKYANQLYVKAQIEHEKMTGVKALKIPPMIFCDYNKMKKQVDHNHGNDGMSLRGYYQQVHRESVIMQGDKEVSREIKKVKENIYLLNGVKKEDLLVTAFHELTHDWLTDHYPGIKVAPLWIEEGACQYAAYIYAKKNKYDNNVKKIVRANDEVYGKGFKFYLKSFGENDWPAALRWMARQGYKKAPPAGSRRKH